MLGHHRHASEMAFRWRADDCSLMVVHGPSLPSSTKKKKQEKKSVVKVGPAMTKFRDPRMEYRQYIQSNLS